MCTNSARLVNSLECYMDDLVDCFEDFVKKSLFIISIAVGALILMLGYVLKVVTDRPEVERRSRRAATGISAQNFPTLPKDSTTAADAQPSSGMLPQTSVNSVTIPVLRECRKTSSAGANTGPMSSVPSFDEKILRNVGLSSCSKSCMQGKRSLIRNCSGTRIVIPSVPNCIPNHHLSTSRQCLKYVTARKSCCSMCCDDDDRR